MQVVKRVCTFGSINKPNLVRLALERFAFRGVETLCNDTTVLAKSNKENMKYKPKGKLNLEACVAL